jgi:hypothetical protein
VRLNGFERPFDSYQVTSWVMLAIFVIAFGVLYAPWHGDGAGLAVVTLYAASLLGTILSGAHSMRVDPSDERVISKRAERAGEAPTSPSTDLNSRHYCTICEAFVQEHSKHCRRYVASYLDREMNLIRRLNVRGRWHRPAFAP